MCEFVDKESFGGGVYLDSTTGVEMPDGGTSNLMGLKIKTLKEPVGASRYFALIGH